MLETKSPSERVLPERGKDREARSPAVLHIRTRQDACRFSAEPDKADTYGPDSTGATLRSRSLVDRLQRVPAALPVPRVTPATGDRNVPPSRATRNARYTRN